MVLSEVFWSSFYVFTGGFVLSIAALCYRSKCEDVDLCCGLVHFKRNIALEVKEDLKFGLPGQQQQHALRTREMSPYGPPPQRMVRAESPESGL